MSTKNIKDIVQQIKKLAGPTDLNAPAATPAAKPTGGGGGGGGVVQATPAIKEMQKAMQEFASKVTAYSSTMQKGMGPPAKPGGKPTDVENPNQDRKDFNDFITEQYLATSEVKGVEWSKDQSQMTQADKQKQQTDLIEMDYVIDGLKRIGSSKSELIADNFWDFRTNNALKNIYAFANALLNVEKDFSKNANKIFNISDLRGMYDNIPMSLKDPSKTLSGAEKVERAKNLTPLIEKLGLFYEHYVKKIALNPYYRTYIEKQSPMYTVKAQDQDPGTLTPAEQKRMETADKITVPNVVVPGKKGNQTINVPLSYLKDDKSFQSLLTNQLLGYSAEEATYPEIKKSVLNAIMNHVKRFLSQAPPVQSPPAK